LLNLLAEVIACCEPPPEGGPGHPRSETVRVLVTLRRFLREGTPWRSLRGGDLTGPNTTDRAKMGTKHHLAVDGDGMPVACAVTAANVNETRLFQRLLLAATGVMKRIQDVFADKGYDNERHRAACRAIGARAFIHKRGRPHGSGLGQFRWPVERTLSWLLENKRLGLRYDRCAYIIRSLLQAGCIFLVVAILAREL